MLRFFGRVDNEKGKKSDSSSSLVSEYLGKVIDNADGESKEVNNVRQLLDEQEEDIPCAVRLHIALKAAKGLCYLHKAGCIHGDFKSSGKIGDFGERFLEAKELVTTQVSVQDPSCHTGGTIPFVAPEILKGENPLSCAIYAALECSW